MDKKAKHHYPTRFCRCPAGAFGEERFDFLWRFWLASLTQTPDFQPFAALFGRCFRWRINTVKEKYLEVQ
ncbi:MAG: hypothetical protein AAB316_07825 [Bacteroidota bacterium]